MKKAQQASYEESSSIPVSYRPRAGTYEADLHGHIECPSQFSNIISALGIMEENDEFILNLQSGGGDIDVTDSLIHAMRKCVGHIHVVATGNCSSAATFILLEADSFELSEGFNGTLHCGSVGSGGTYSEYRQQTNFYNKFMEKTLRGYYTGFLTTDELDSMLDGKDILVDAEEFAERYQKRNKYLESLVEAQQDEELLAQEDKECCEGCSCNELDTSQEPASILKQDEMPKIKPVKRSPKQP